MQKMICILLCTVFPLVTTLATLLRLWQSGMFVSASTPSPISAHITGGGSLFWSFQRLELPSKVTDCPSGWLPYNHTCLHQVPGAMTWSQARDTCHKLSAKLPNSDNKSTETSSLHKYLVSKFPAPLWVVENVSSNSRDTCPALSSPGSGGVLILEAQCGDKLTGVCIKGRKGSLYLDLDSYLLAQNMPQ